MSSSAVRKLIYQERQTGSKFPKTIPKNRDHNCINKYIFILLPLVTIIYLFFSHNFLYDILLLLRFPFLWFVCEILYRLFYIYVEELRHIDARYDNKRSKLFKEWFLSQSWSWVYALAIIYIIVVGVLLYTAQIKLDFMDYRFIVCGVFTFLLTKLRIYDNKTLNKFVKLSEDDGLDYGAGIANSFFYGYLKLILSTSQQKNLRELFEKYEARQGVTIPVHKLFILIPRSAYCLTTLMDDRFPNVEESSSLEEIILTVAGVQNRVYKNSVYKVVDVQKKERVYVCVEYATPLKTFHDSILNSANYIRYRNDIVYQFYKSLKNILELHPDCEPYCELIYYDDWGSDGKLVDVSQIILSRVKDIKKKQ